MKVSMVRILRPDFVHLVRGQHIIPKTSDYVEVPRLAMYSTTPIVELLPMETLAKLLHLRTHLAMSAHAKK